MNRIRNSANRHRKQWDFIEETQRFLTPHLTIHGERRLEGRRQAIHAITDDELPHLGDSEINNQWLEVLLDKFDEYETYDPLILRELLEGRGKELLSQEMLRQCIQDITSLTSSLNKRLREYEDKLEEERQVVTTHLLSRKFTFRSLTPFWEVLIQLQTELTAASEDMESLGEMVEEAKKQKDYRLRHEEQLGEYQYIDQLRPLIDALYDTLAESVETLRGWHSRLVESNTDSLTRVKDALEFTTAQSAYQTQLNTSILNLIFLVAAVASVFALLQISTKELSENLGAAISLGVLTLVVAIVLAITIDLVVRLLPSVNAAYNRLASVLAKKFKKN